MKLFYLLIEVIPTHKHINEYLEKNGIDYKRGIKVTITSLENILGVLKRGKTF